MLFRSGRGLPVVVAPFDVHLALGTKIVMDTENTTFFFLVHNKSTMMVACNGEVLGLKVSEYGRSCGHHNSCGIFLVPSNIL